MGNGHIYECLKNLRLEDKIFSTGTSGRDICHLKSAIATYWPSASASTHPSFAYKSKSPHIRVLSCIGHPSCHTEIGVEDCLKSINTLNSNLRGMEKEIKHQKENGKPKETTTFYQ